MATNIPGLTEDETVLFNTLKQDLYRVQQRNGDLVQFYESERSARSMGRTGISHPASSLT